MHTLFNGGHCGGACFANFALGSAGASLYILFIVSLHMKLITKFIENVKRNVLHFEWSSRTRQLTCDSLALLGCSLASEHFIYSRKMF